MLHAKRPDVGELLQCSGPRGSMFSRNAWSFSQLLQEVIYVFSPAFLSIRDEDPKRIDATLYSQKNSWVNIARPSTSSFSCTMYRLMMGFSVLYRIILELTKIYMSVAFFQDTRIKCALHVLHGHLKKNNCHHTIFVYIFHHLQKTESA